MSRYIDRVHLMNRIATECHYDTEHPLESYAKLMQVINEEEGFAIKQYCVVKPKEESMTPLEGQISIWKEE